jgi:hypothetical protein
LDWCIICSDDEFPTDAVADVATGISSTLHNQ